MNYECSPRARRARARTHTLPTRTSFRTLSKNAAVESVRHTHTHSTSADFFSYLVWERRCWLSWPRRRWNTLPGPPAAPAAGASPPPGGGRLSRSRSAPCTLHTLDPRRGRTSCSSRSRAPAPVPRTPWAAACTAAARRRRTARSGRAAPRRRRRAARAPPARRAHRAGGRRRRRRASCRSRAGHRRAAGESRRRLRRTLSDTASRSAFSICTFFYANLLVLYRPGGKKERANKSHPPLNE